MRTQCPCEGFRVSLAEVWMAEVRCTNVTTEEPLVVLTSSSYTANRSPIQHAHFGDRVFGRAIGRALSTRWEDLVLLAPSIRGG
jgi:hypothetical protein